MNLITYRRDNAVDFADEIREWMNRSYSHRPAKPPKTVLGSTHGKKSKYILETEVHGMESEHINLEVLNDHLIIKGAITRDANEELPQYRV